MKKLIAAGCCILFFNTFSKVSTENDDDSERKTSGQKVLVKAIAVMVNNEANKKIPPKRIFIASAEPPVF